MTTPNDQSGQGEDSDRLALLRLLQVEFDEALVVEMAEYDGGMGKEDNLPELREILRSGRIPSLSKFHSSEICNLLRYGKSQLDRTLTPKQRREQIMTLFACWILVNAYVTPERREHGYFEDGDERVLLTLLECNLALGTDFIPASLRFLGWAQTAGKSVHDPSENVFYLLSLMLLRCMLADPANLAAALAAYDSLVEEEQKARHQMDAEGCWRPGPDWLFGLYTGYKPWGWQKRWVRLTARILEDLRQANGGILEPKLVEFQARVKG